MELETRRFYDMPACRTTDVAVRAAARRARRSRARPFQAAHALERQHLTPAAEEEEDTARRVFLLQVVQPGLVGLMDGSVSTLAPLFAAAFATRNSWDAFLVGHGRVDRRRHLDGLRRSALRRWRADRPRPAGHPRHRQRRHDRGRRHRPHASVTCSRTSWSRPIVAVAVVIVELWVISYIRYRYMDTPFLAGAFQVVVGGVLVFLTGVLIGNA